MTLLMAEMQMLQSIQPREISGTIVMARGLSLLGEDLPLPIGSLVRIENGPSDVGVGGRSDEVPLRGEVVGFENARSIIMLFGQSGGVAPGARVVGEQASPTVLVGASQLGRVFDGLGRPIDGKRLPTDLTARLLHPPPVSALKRRRIQVPLETGIRAIDSMLTLGKGQRVGVFSGPGVGKSTVLASIARHASADVNVIALIGERGREVREFIERALGPAGLARSVVIVATGDESPLLRVRAAFVACTIAEYFRDRGDDVLLMMDSITRFAQAQRQIGLTVGEQPATKGYTPSVFALLPQLLERAGAVEGRGSITGLYAVLVEGDDLNEPISDACRGVLDGHIALSRKLASRGHYPAIDVLQSISRVADDVCDQSHIAFRRELVKLLAAYAEAEELINIGAYTPGSNQDTDVAIAMRDRIAGFLQQGALEPSSIADSNRMLKDLLTEAQTNRSMAQQGKRKS